ncbi:5-formyltetrahydrofolate cyclo-ligase [Facilibium subflavum]|uniref:5-formyltetrahydrofolate cyclo-ligase n=1 Tax=Facilibium subflavum TaxID=2219058 RepID=UPI000E65B2B9|nr:5-formyltetrahydrofolate cyclo-ligase [Facilibium subflavum]
MDIRQTLRQKRQALSPTIKETYEQLLYQQFLTVFSDIANLKIASYKATAEEISPALIDLFLKSQNNTLYYPALHPLHLRHLWFIQNHGKWVKNKYHLLEPAIDFDLILEPWELDIVLVPLVGFDTQKNRIGMGGGFYDTSFSFRRSPFFKTPKLIGIAFDEQQVNTIAINSWDITMDVIITPTQVIQ